MSIDFVYLLEVLLFPLTALLIPWILATFKWRKDRVKPRLSRSQGAKIGGLSIVFSIFIFSALTFLTGGVSTYFFLEEGLISVSDREFAWNVTKHVRILIPFYPGSSFLVVAILSGIFYAGLLVLPPYCAVPSVTSDAATADVPETSTNSSNESGLSATTTSTTSSLAASASALASGAVCCSTSMVALIAPAFGALLAPISPFLIIFSLAILDFSLWRFLMPRIPTT